MVRVIEWIVMGFVNGNELEPTLELDIDSIADPSWNPRCNNIA